MTCSDETSPSPSSAGSQLELGLGRKYTPLIMHDACCEMCSIDERCVVHGPSAVLLVVKSVVCLPRLRTAGFQCVSHSLRSPWLRSWRDIIQRPQVPPVSPFLHLHLHLLLLRLSLALSMSLRYNLFDPTALRVDLLDVPSTTHPAFSKDLFDLVTYPVKVFGRESEDGRPRSGQTDP